MEQQLHQGLRGEPFATFLRELLSLSNLNPQYYDILLDKEGLILYDQAFTHTTSDSENNYEYLEFLGDVTLNKCIAWYLSRRFPQLNCSQGVKVLTRLKINLISKKSFAEFAKKLHFWEFVSADDEVRSTKMDKTLEDVFEAFFGATEVLIDSRVRQGAGGSICYNIIEHLLDSRNISLKYEELFDAKTRLKEIFDYFGEKLGELDYEADKRERMHYINVYRKVITHVERIRNKDYVAGQTLAQFHNDLMKKNPNISKKKLQAKQLPEEYVEKKHHKVIFLADGYAPLKADGEQRAAEKAIKLLNQQGFVKPMSESYAKFCS